MLPLTAEDLAAATARARARLIANPDLIAKMETLGRERELIYKTLVLTGLRKGELASVTVGQLVLDADPAFLVLDAADEKNREGSTIPLRSDLPPIFANGSPTRRRTAQCEARGACRARLTACRLPGRSCRQIPWCLTCRMGWSRFSTGT